METEPGRRCCAKRGRKGLQVSGQSAVAAVDRISPPEPRRRLQNNNARMAVQRCDI